MSITGRILIIDDEAAIRQTLTRILRRAGFEVTSAESGNEALDYLRKQEFDLIYLDIRMPDMSGLEALEILHDKYPDTPVVLFTAQPDLNSAIQAMRAGAIDYLLKPLKPQEIIDRTQSTLLKQEKDRKKRELQNQIDRLQGELKTLDLDEETQPEESQSGSPDRNRYLTVGYLTLDLHTRRLSNKDQSVDLPPTSFDYLLVLARHSPNVVDYQTLVAEAQGFKAEKREAQELVKWHVHQIRGAIEPNPSKPTLLINVRGTGYRLVID